MSVWISLPDCIDRRLYRVKARNFSFAVFFKERSAFAGIRHKFGNTFVDEELHWDLESRGTCKPLECLPETLPDVSTREFLDEMIEKYQTPAFFSGHASMVLTPPPDVTAPATALWTAVATAGPWTSGPVRRYHARMAVAAAWEALGEAVRASGPVQHGWKTP